MESSSNLLHVEFLISTPYLLILQETPATVVFWTQEHWAILWSVFTWRHTRHIVVLLEKNFNELLLSGTQTERPWLLLFESQRTECKRSVTLNAWFHCGWVLSKNSDYRFKIYLLHWICHWRQGFVFEGYKLSPPPPTKTYILLSSRYISNYIAVHMKYVFPV